jgi:hypothetical protein
MTSIHLDNLTLLRSAKIINNRAEHPQSQHNAPTRPSWADKHRIISLRSIPESHDAANDLQAGRQSRNPQRFPLDS